MARLIWGFVALVSLACLFVGCSVSAHTVFEGPKVVHETEKRYVIECSTIQLLSDTTEVVLLVSDLQEPRESLRFRVDEMEKHPPILFILRPGRLAMDSRLRGMEIPKDFEVAKAYPNETVRIRLKFESIDKSMPQDANVPRRSMVDELWLKYEDFPPLKLVRADPVDDQITAFFVEEISLGKATLLFLCGLFGAPIATIFGFAKKIPARLRLPESNRNTMPHAQQEATSVDAKNAVPREWESDVIATGFRKFQAKPQLLDIYVKEITKRLSRGFAWLRQARAPAYCHHAGC